MAKEKDPTNEFDINEYIDNLLADEDVDDATKEAFASVLARDNVADKFRQGYLRQSDYSRNMDRVRDKEKQLEAEIEKSRSFYERQIEQDHNNMQKWNEMQREYDRLKSRGDDFYLDDDDFDPSAHKRQPETPPDVVTQDEFNRALRNLEQTSVQLLGQTVNYAQEHMKEFNEPLDAEGLYSYALENKLPIKVAYEQYTAEQREEARERKYKADLEAARKRGAEEERSKHGLPAVDSRPRGIHALRPPKDVPKTRKDRVDAAVRDFMQGGES